MLNLQLTSSKREHPNKYALDVTNTNLQRFTGKQTKNELIIFNKHCNLWSKQHTTAAQNLIQEHHDTSQQTF